MNSNTLDLIRSNDHRTISKVITNIENEKNISNSILDDVYAEGKKAIRLGITGPPGSGKSTLTDQLIQQILNDGKSVGIVAVDPTSPYTGGALLGDRVRMNNYELNDNVFIRSMGSHGSLGGLATKAQIVGDVIAASGKDIIIFETVGVGQGEYDVIKVVDLTIVVLVPEAGDDIQLMKAGLIEVADLFVINKSDRDGADRLLKSLNTILNTVFNNKDIIPSVFSTSADRSIGIEQLYNGIDKYLIMVKNNNLFNERQLDRYRNRVLSLIKNKLISEFWTSGKIKQLDKATKNIKSTKISPHKLAEELLAQ
jgi:LAO/AO transport system kinase